MAYGEKYRFTFLSDTGVEHVIKILQDGYSGTVKHRHLGGAPVLKRQQNGCIHGSSLTFKAEAQADSEFAELYTSDNKEFRVDLFRNNVVVWTGFISTEMYSEPCIAPPYDVELTANDGLGELKLVDFEAQGMTTMGDLLGWLLRKTGRRGNILVMSALQTSMAWPDHFFDRLYINVDYLLGKNCYEVLEYVLNAMRADIFLYGTNWFILRESDYSSISGSISVIRISGSTGAVDTVTYSASEIKKSIGQMYVADMWPIGFLSQAIVPARYKAVTNAPWHLANAFLDPDFGTNEQSQYWTRVNCIQVGTQGIVMGTPLTAGSVKQSVSLTRMVTPINLTIYAANNYGPELPPQHNLDNYGKLSVELKLIPTNGIIIYGTKDGWITNQSTAAKANTVDLRVVVPKNSELDTTAYNEVVVEMSFPTAEIQGDAILEVTISGYFCTVYRVALTQVMGNAGYQEVVAMNNGAVGAAEDVETFGTVEEASTQLNSPLFLAGVFLEESQGVYVAADEFSDANVSNDSFLHVAAMAYARQVALPRLKTVGKLDMPAGLSVPPLFLENNVTSWLQTFEWDLLHDELNIEAISLPSATLSVQGITVNALDGDHAAGGGSAGGGSGSGGGSYSSITQLAELYDVALFSLAAGDLLYYDATAQKWKNATKATLFSEYALKTELDEYLKYKGWAHGDSDVNADASNAIWGSWLWANNTGQEIDHTPAGYGAIISFGKTGNYGPGQLAIDNNGIPYTRIGWYENDSRVWRAWHGLVTLDTDQTISGVKTFTMSIYLGYGQSTSNLANRRLYFVDASHFIELDADGNFHFSHALYSDSGVSAGGNSSGGGGGGAEELDDLDDVTITGTPADGEVLSYSNGAWRNVNIGSLGTGYVTLATVQEITAQKTFSGKVILAGVALQFKSADSATAYGSLLIGNGYGQIGIGNSLFNFHPSNGFYFTGGGVPCGGSSNRWSNVYSVAGNFSGIVTVNGVETLDQSHNDMALFNYGARSTKSFNGYGTAFNMRAHDAQGAQQNILAVTTYGALTNKYFVVGDGASTGAARRIYFGAVSNNKYIELDADGNFHFSASLYSDGGVSAGGNSGNAVDEFYVDGVEVGAKLAELEQRIEALGG